MASWGSSAPWMQQSKKEVSLKGRKLINDSRYVGCINEWHGSWGWIEPLDVVVHASAKKNKGRIYVNRTDARNYMKMEVGTQLDFQIYCDARGLGAIDCTEVEKGIEEAAAAVAAGDEALPDGWEKHWSAENGEFYYWNRITKETSWTAPEKVVEESDDLPLPQGWTKHYDEENQQWYYWDKKAKKASWERPSAPTGEEEPAEEDEPAAKKARHEELPATDAPVLGQQRVRGKIVEWHGFFGWIKPLQAVPEDVRPLLEKGEGKIYLNWRDVQPGLDVKVTVEVDFMLYEDSNGLAASDVRIPGADKPDVSKKAVNKLARKWAEEDEEVAGEAAEAAAAAEEGGYGQVGEGPLLPGWTAIWSAEHECNYYWHSATKTAVWERPAMPVGEDEYDEEASEATAPPAATPMTPLVSQSGRAMTPVTPGAAQALAAKHAAPQKSDSFHAAQSSGVFRGREGPLRKISTNVGGPGSKPWMPQQPKRYLQSWER